MKELAIGEEIRIRCVEDNDGSCNKCFFRDMHICDGKFCCLVGREDGKNVHLELVED